MRLEHIAFVSLGVIEFVQQFVNRGSRFVTSWLCGVYLSGLLISIYTLVCAAISFIEGKRTDLAANDDRNQMQPALNRNDSERDVSSATKETQSVLTNGDVMEKSSPYGALRWSAAVNPPHGIRSVRKRSDLDSDDKKAEGSFCVPVGHMRIMLQEYRAKCCPPGIHHMKPHETLQAVLMNFAPPHMVSDYDAVVDLPLGPFVEPVVLKHPLPDVFEAHLLVRAKITHMKKFALTNSSNPGVTAYMAIRSVASKFLAQRRRTIDSLASAEYMMALNRQTLPIGLQILEVLVDGVRYDYRSPSFDPHSRPWFRPMMRRPGALMMNNRTCNCPTWPLQRMPPPPGVGPVADEATTTATEPTKTKDEEPGPADVELVSMQAATLRDPDPATSEALIKIEEKSFTALSSDTDDLVGDFESNGVPKTEESTTLLGRFGKFAQGAIFPPKRLPAPLTSPDSSWSDFEESWLWSSDDDDGSGSSSESDADSKQESSTSSEDDAGDCRA